MKPTAILVDGPKRGETVYLHSPYQSDYLVAIPRPIRIIDNWLEESLIPEPAIETAHYMIHRLKMFGEFLLIGSLSATPRDCDLFEALASRTAKDAVLR